MLDRELVEAVMIVEQAGDMLLKFYNSTQKVHFKAGAEPVTQADTEVNDFVVTKLRRLFPNDGIVAEESGGEVTPTRSGRFWYIDPLDGTKEFLARNGEFAVMIGLTIDGEARLGVVYQPVSRKLYRGVVGEGAFCEEGDTTRVLQVREVFEPSQARLVSSRSHRSPKVDVLVKRLGIQEEVNIGSIGLKAGLVVEQKADLYVHFSKRLAPWDICAADALVRAAGGLFVDIQGLPFSYAGGQIAERNGVVACHPNLFGAIAPTLAQLNGNDEVSSPDERV